MNDAPTIAERVARATRSSHLEQKEGHADIDLIGAVGLASISNGAASIVYRLKYAHQVNSYPEALRIVKAESKALGRRLNWTGPGEQFRAMAKAVLDYWLNDRCIACGGVGHQKELGAPFLQAMPCPSCDGTSRAPRPSMTTKEWDGRFNQLLVRIEDLERRAGGDVIAKLADSLSDFR